MKNFYSLFLVLLFALQLNASNDKYRLTLRGNPATSIVIGWDQTSGSNPVVYYDTVDHGINVNNYPFTRSVDRSVYYKGMNNTFARLTGLKPDTVYYFIIKDSQGVSERFWFKTAPGDNSRLSFIAGGDSRNNRTPRRNANSLVAKLKPHAVLFGGDMTNGDSSNEWKEWFIDWQLTIARDNRMFPIVATRGNHEDSNSSIYNLFDVPSSNVYYAITFGQNLVRTYTLNTEISIAGNQTTWLENDLNANSDVLWKMAQYHKPMRPHVSSKREGNNQYNYWADLFYNKGVKLVVECDAHTVKSTWPIRPSSGSGNDEGFVRDNQNGTVYVGEGCWGAPLRSNNDGKTWTRNSASFNQFKWIFVDENKIETRTIKIDNASQVDEVSNANVFTAPSNLDIWNPSNGSVITINRDGAVDPDPDSGTITVPIANGADDVEEDSNGTLYANSSDLELVYDASNNSSFQTIGLRFQSIRLPKNATITNAYLQFTADESNSATTELRIALENSSNSSSFSTSNNVSGRLVYSNRVTWRPSAWTSGERGSAQRSPNLKGLVQNLVNASGWQSGNSASFVITGTGVSSSSTSAIRVADSYEGGAGKAARLVVNYTTASNPPNDICDGVAEWRSGVSYQTGDKVTYQGNLFERTPFDWKFLGACTTTRIATATRNKIAYPEIKLEVAEEQAVAIYPNPFSGDLQIDVPTQEGSVAIEIYRVGGSLVYAYQHKAGKITLPLHRLDKGIYFITVRNEVGKTLQVKKLLKN